MKTRILGKDLEVSAVGLGCMGMSHAYGPASDKKEMTELLSKAVDKGYTFFDTAEVYGTPENPHDNEELLGEALKPYRNRIVLASKCGIRFDEDSTAVNKPLIPDGRPETIKKSVEGSLKRLQTDHLDLYYIHRIDRNVPIEETAGAMKELIGAGKITHWGISEADEATLRKAHAVCPVTAVQNRYSMMYRDYEALFPVLEDLQIGFVAFSPLANGFLSAKYNKDSRFDAGTDYRGVMPQFSPEGMDKNKEMIGYLTEVADRKTRRPRRYLLPGCWRRNRGSCRSRGQGNTGVWSRTRRQQTWTLKNKKNRTGTACGKRFPCQKYSADQGYQIKSEQGRAGFM